MPRAEEALQRLREGNARFVSNGCDMSARTTQSRRTELVQGQHPFAIILGCSDSRVPAELVFDQGLGELFVIRVAGNIVTPSLIGSVEFSAEQHGVRLVVVLGHSHCGAVIATLDALQRNQMPASPNLGSIVDSIRPAVQTLVDGENNQSHNELLNCAIRANVRASAATLLQTSDPLQRLVENDELKIVGAEYSLDTGKVDFFHGV